MEYLLRHKNTLVIGVCVNSPKDICSKYRGIKLLSHTMKLWERIIDQWLRDIVSISDGQFGFKPGVGTTDAIFVNRTLCE